MRDPMTAGGPYVGTYRDWDLWCYMNARDVSDPEAMAPLEDGLPEGWVMLYGGVDDSGYVVPYVDNYRQRLEWEHGVAEIERPACAATMICAGEIDGRLHHQLKLAQAGVRAAFVPPLPAWLGKEPPKMAIMLPDGMFAVWGELGTGEGYEGEAPYGRMETGDECWYLYGTAGELVKSGAPGGEWWHLTFEDFEEVLGLEENLRVECYEYNGMVMAYDSANWESHGQFTYDGQPLDDPDTLYSGESRVVKLYGGEIPLIYAAQGGE